MLAAGEHMAKTLSPEGSPIGRSYYLGDASSPKVQVTELLDCVWITADSEVKLKRSMIGLWRGGHRSMKQKSRSPKQRKHPKTRLRLPDLEFSKSAVLNSLRSVDGQRGYGHAIDEFVDWYCSEPRLALNRTVVLRYRSYLEARLLAPGTVNLRLGAVRRLAYEAADSGLLSSDLAAGIRRVKGVRNLGVRLGNWLTVEQSLALWQAPDGEKLKGKRDRALLALLLACGLRRHEAVGLRIEHLEQREEHWAIVDLKGKAGHVRTVPVPGWVMEELRIWLDAAVIDRGKIFRRVTKMGRVLGEGMTEKAVWHIVKDSAKRIGLEKLAPHDLRRTCARLCHASGGELEQIQFLLGHVSIQTTERYLGCKQRIRSAVNDQIGIEPRP
jgi:site-specific recombinase XerD